jgi:hypothetical protein
MPTGPLSGTLALLSITMCHWANPLTLWTSAFGAMKWNAESFGIIKTLNPCDLER